MSQRTVDGIVWQRKDPIRLLSFEGGQTTSLAASVQSPFRWVSFETYFSRLNFSEITYQLFLLFLGITALFLIILVKSKTATEFWSDPLLFFYTIFVTIFQLSRVVGAMFYRHSASQIISEARGGGIMNRL